MRGITVHRGKHGRKRKAHDRERDRGAQDGRVALSYHPNDPPHGEESSEREARDDDALRPRPYADGHSGGDDRQENNPPLDARQSDADRSRHAQDEQTGGHAWWNPSQWQADRPKREEKPQT